MEIINEIIEELEDFAIDVRNEGNDRRYKYNSEKTAKRILKIIKKYEKLNTK